MWKEPHILRARERERGNEREVLPICMQNLMLTSMNTNKIIVKYHWIMTFVMNEQTIYVQNREKITDLYRIA